MRMVIQRVTSASVHVDGSPRGVIAHGLAVLVGFAAGDQASALPWAAEKLAGLRIFTDPQDKMNLSVQDVGGAVLLIPNFTLAGDAVKGRRPSFDRAMRPGEASVMFDRLGDLLAEKGVHVERGVFRAHMVVSIVNDGPVTLVIDVPQPGNPAAGM